MNINKIQLNRCSIGIIFCLTAAILMIFDIGEIPIRIIIVILGIILIANTNKKINN